ncbi:hypothetical protein BBK36DRAFT_23870 [Trichoderma citrinoviride]|uniref:Uncharacterized protein n=1 Tax=Trichoderma citrinoviride TaxID=58853 RepID=A0A2T4AY53_9HYPO|nr:hypothetical protein BBK36DRAFT_23870 [Trichoderma citrinoviride]PTB62012.1 hypothetical protein BBK36DRAFT_23870 [Trichoderma citrinoviride]
MAIVAEYFPPLSQPRDGNLSTSRRNNLQTLRRRQRDDVSIVRRGAIRRPSHTRPVYVVINNIAIHTGTGRPQTPAAADDADESEPHEAQPSVVGIVGSEMATDSHLTVQRPKLDIDVVAERPTTAESRSAEPECRGMFDRLSRYISRLWS